MDINSAASVWPGVEVRDLHSAVLDQDLVIYVKLPWSYADSDRTYPVLYCPDSNRSFQLYSTMSLIYETPGVGFEQEIIIAGIGYKLDADRLRGLTQWAAWRTRDLTPVRSAETDAFWAKLLSGLLKGEPVEVHSGGAARFLRALREEVFPFVEASYRVSIPDRGLAGYSYGGLFGLFALFHAPELFTKVFAGSPSIWKELFTYEEEYASVHADLPVRLFMTIGGLEDEGIEPVQRMIERLRSRSYPGLDLQSQVFDGEGHSSGMAAAVSRALRELYYST